MVAGLMTAVVQVALGGLVGGVLGGLPGAMLGVAVGLALGLPLGWAVRAGSAYDLGTARGAAEFLVDHTWSLPNTVLGSLFLSVNLLRGNRLDREQSRHAGCVILTRGALPGYATTVGTVQAGTTAAIRAHEDLHVGQARLFGPLYLPLVALHYVVATVIPYWLIRHDRQAAPIDSVGAYFIRGVYRNVWHEWWAFRSAPAAPRRHP
jgi:hypothetical protein